MNMMNGKSVVTGRSGITPVTFSVSLLLNRTIWPTASELGKYFFASDLVRIMVLGSARVLRNSGFTEAKENVSKISGSANATPPSSTKY